MPERRIIATDNAPAAIGPYSQGVSAAGLLFCSGQIPLDPATGELIQGDVSAQARRCLENLSAVCRAAATRLESAVRVTVYLADMADFQAVNDVYTEFFPAEPPARVAVAAAGLPKGALVEIDAVVVV
ncbi:MAG TPA: Rid family detoxifying hydrolase [Thermoleophilaceae bacterium]|nr:Rid family detoxifying hydrolase [Thermoleophilaceae bacterium]